MPALTVFTEWRAFDGARSADVIGLPSAMEGWLSIQSRRTHDRGQRVAQLVADVGGKAPVAVDPPSGLSWISTVPPSSRTCRSTRASPSPAPELTVRAAVVGVRANRSKTVG